MSEQIPTPKFCPYCGARALKFVGMVPRCITCRAVFHLQFSRLARQSPTTKASDPNKLPHPMVINLSTGKVRRATPAEAKAYEKAGRPVPIRNKP